MANATAVTASRGREQFQGIFSDMWEVSATIDADSLSTGTNDTDTITVPGIALGDVVVGVSLGVSLAGMQVTAYVSAANTVTIVFNNITGGTVNLASTTIKVLVARPSF